MAGWNATTVQKTEVKKKVDFKSDKIDDPDFELPVGTPVSISEMQAFAHAGDGRLMARITQPKEGWITWTYKGASTLKLVIGKQATDHHDEQEDDAVYSPDRLSLASADGRDAAVELAGERVLDAIDGVQTLARRLTSTKIASPSGNGDGTLLDLSTGKEALGDFTPRGHHCTTHSPDPLGHYAPDGVKALGIKFNMPGKDSIYVGISADMETKEAPIIAFSGLRFPVFDVGVFFSRGTVQVWGPSGHEISKSKTDGYDDLGYVHRRRRPEDLYSLFLVDKAWYFAVNDKIVHKYDHVVQDGQAVYMQAGNGGWCDGSKISNCRVLSLEDAEKAHDAVQKFGKQPWHAKLKGQGEAMALRFLPRGAQKSVAQGHKYGVKGMAVSPDGSLLITVAGDGVKVWDSKTGQCKQHDPLSVGSDASESEPTQHRGASAVDVWESSAIVGTLDGSLLRLELSNVCSDMGGPTYNPFECKGELKNYTGVVTCVRVVGARCYSCSPSSGIVKETELSSMSNGRQFNFGEGWSNPDMQVSCIDACDRFLVGGGHRTASFVKKYWPIIDLTTGKRLDHLQVIHLESTIAIGTGGRIAAKAPKAVGSVRRGVVSAEEQSRGRISDLDVADGQSESYTYLRVLGDRVITCPRDGTVRVFDWTPFELRHTIVGHNAQVNALAFCAGAPSTLFTGSQDGEVIRWDTLYSDSTNKYLDCPAMRFQSIGIAELVVPVVTLAIAQAQLCSASFSNPSVRWSPAVQDASRPLSFLALDIDAQGFAYGIWLAKIFVALPAIAMLFVIFYGGTYEKNINSTTRDRCKKTYTSDLELFNSVRKREGVLGLFNMLFKLLSGVAFMPVTLAMVTTFNCRAGNDGVWRFQVNPDVDCTAGLHPLLLFLSAVGLLLLWSAALPLKVLHCNMRALLQEEARLSAGSKLKFRLSPCSLASTAKIIVVPWCGEFTPSAGSAYYQMATILYSAGAACAKVLLAPNPVTQAIVLSVLSMLQLLACLCNQPFPFLKPAVTAAHVSTVLCAIMGLVTACINDAENHWPSIALGVGLAITWSACLFSLRLRVKKAEARTSIEVPLMKEAVHFA